MPERNVTDHPPVRNDGSDDRRTRLRKKSPVHQQRNAYGTRWLLSLLFIIYYITIFIFICPFMLHRRVCNYFFHPSVDSRGNANFSCPRVRVQSHTFAIVLIFIIIINVTIIIIIIIIIVSSPSIYQSAI